METTGGHLFSCDWTRPSSNFQSSVDECLSAAIKADQPSLNAAQKELYGQLQLFNETMKSRTFLVGERLSCADLFLALQLLPAFKHILTQQDRDRYVNVTRWFLTIVHQAPVKSIVGEVPLSVDASKKQPEKKKEEKKKPAATAVEEDEPEDAPQEKFVDPLAALPAGKFNMDAWKRCYSNEDTATKAIPYFWENFDPETHSIWRCDYKYPEDLSLAFMSCNLISGMFQRLEKLRKYAFGSLCLFGKDNDSTISGVWIWRGHDLVFPMCADWTIDYESYSWKKLDPQSDDTKKMVNEYWLWEGDFEGKSFNQGKIYK